MDPTPFDAPLLADVDSRPFLLNEKEARVALEATDVCATTLAMIAQVTLGADVWDMNPSDVAASLEDKFDCELSDSNFNKLHAWSLATTTPMFFEDTAAFASICSALSDGDPVDDIEALLSGELEAPAIYWAMVEVGMAYGDDEPEFSTWVKAFILRTLDSESGDLDVDNIPFYRSEYVVRKLRDLKSELVRLGAPQALISEILPD